MGANHRDDDEEELMVDPVVGAAVAGKALGRLGGPFARLLERLLGPSVDVAGEVMANRLSERLQATLSV